MWYERKGYEIIILFPPTISSLFLHLSLFITLTIYVSLSPSLFLSLCVCLSVSHSLYLSIHLPLSIYLSLCVCLSLTLSLYLPLTLPLSLHLSSLQSTTAIDELSVLKGFVEHEAILFPKLKHLPPAIDKVPYVRT